MGAQVPISQAKPKRTAENCQAFHRVPGFLSLPQPESDWRSLPVYNKPYQVRADAIQ
jgi:hypothetical protein